MPLVRTTKQPWLEIEVGDAEFLDLKRQGLLVEQDATPPEEKSKAASSLKKPGGTG